MGRVFPGIKPQGHSQKKALRQPASATGRNRKIKRWELNSIQSVSFPFVRSACQLYQLIQQIRKEFRRRFHRLLFAHVHARQL